MASMNAAGLANALRVEREQHATAISVRETAVRALDSLRTAVGEALCQFLPRDDGNTWNVVDRFLGIQLGALAAGPIQDVDQMAFKVQQAELENGK